MEKGKRVQPSLSWRVWLVIFACSIVLASLVAWNKWSEVYGDLGRQLSDANLLVSKGTNSVLYGHQATLNYLGVTLLRHYRNGNIEAATTIADAGVDNNPALVAMGLAKPNGELVVVSSNIHIPSGYSLLDHAESRDGFMEALELNRMSIGRTYYFKPINKWIIPIRYALRNGSGEVEAVMTAAIDLDSTRAPWAVEDTLSDNIHLDLLRGFDMYHQYLTLLDPSEYEEYYTQPIPQELLDYVNASMTEQSGTTLNKLMDEDRGISVFRANLDGREFVIAVAYSAPFNYYVATMILANVVWGKFLTSLLLILAIWLGFSVITFLLFKMLMDREKRNIQSLEYQVDHDPLTDLPNRQRFYRDCAEKIAVGDPFSLLFLDLDKFKQINDVHGHPVGDEVLQVISRRLTLIPLSIQCYRHGGDEFLLMIDEVDQEKLTKLCRDLIDAIHEPIEIHSREFSIRGSIGVCVYPLDARTVEDLLRKSDMAMYSAKEMSKPGAMFNSELELEQERFSLLDSEMDFADLDEQMYLYYQPKLDMKSALPIGFEVLLRWVNPALGAVQPDEFIPVAEACGHINRLGEFVFRQALSDLKSLDLFQQGIKKPIQISFNVSVLQLMEDDFEVLAEHYIEKFSESGYEVILEMTESIFIRDVVQVAEKLNRLIDSGALISIDDFGTGYSSMKYLESLPIHELKIDKSFVGNLQTINPDNWEEEKYNIVSPLIYSMIEIGRNMGIRTVAEGIESEVQYQALLAMGCDIAQGYLFSRPIDKSALKDFFINPSH